jgi:aryl-alcohol dehydrogenase-like predicted oxidoreductase
MPGVHCLYTPRIALDPESVCSIYKETPMLTRRDCLSLTATTCAASTLLSRLASAQAGDLITRAIPSSGERLPLIGLGSSASFAQFASAGNLDPLREVFRTLLDAGGTVFDTAPSYGRGSSEEAAGQIVAELGATERIFWATKVNVARGGFRGGGGSAGADPAAARAQIDASFDLLRADPIDLIQVHNLGDVPTQLGILKELKEAGRVRYIGATTTNAGQYGQLVEWMRNEPLDFIGIDYAVDNTTAAETVFPVAIDRGIAVLGYAPTGRTRLFSRVGDRAIPQFARELGIETWAQFFLKFAAAHPAMTTATSDAEHMLDNMGAAFGALPDASDQQRMIDFVDALPQA